MVAYFVMFFFFINFPITSLIVLQIGITHFPYYFLDGEFAKTQQNFLTKYCSIFENDDENKLIYTEIFNEYVSICVVHNRRWYSM